MNILGLDPGKKGGYALIENGGFSFGDMPLCFNNEKVTYNQATYRDSKLPKSRKKWVVGSIVDPHEVYKKSVAADVVYVERQFVRGRQKGALTTGKNYGIILASVILSGTRLCIIESKAWQQWIASHYKREFDDTKELSVAYCNDRDYHQLKKDGISDAICITRYGEHIEQNK